MSAGAGGSVHGCSSVMRCSVPCVRGPNLIFYAPPSPPMCCRRHEGATMNTLRLAGVVVLLAVLIFVPVAHGQLLLSTNDNKVTLVNGVATVVKNPPPDTLTVIDIKSWPPKVVAELDVPGSVVGPPFSVAVAPDESIALVTANEKLDPSDPTKRIPNNTMSVVDLKVTPPRIIATLETGKAPAGVSINRAGTLALVANRAEGTVSVFTIQGKTVTPAGKVTIADEKSGTSHATISPDGKLALVTRVGEAAIGHWSQGAAFSPDGKHIFVGNMVEKEIQVLGLDGTTLKDTGVRIAVKGGPAATRIADK